jgi:hypothetical protein
MKVISNISNTIGSIAQATQSTAQLLEKVVGEHGLGKFVDQVSDMSEEALDETIEDMRLDREERAIERTHRIAELKKKYAIEHLEDTPKVANAE